MRYGGKQELATEGSPEVQELLTRYLKITSSLVPSLSKVPLPCPRLELALLHGMRTPTTSSLGLAVIRNVKDLVTQKDFGGQDSGGVWRMVRGLFE